MTIREWIREREITGNPAFSFDEIRRSFESTSDRVIRNELYRQTVRKRIFPVYRGFYVIIPPQYAAKNFVPPVYYIEQLMAYLRKPYYYLFVECGRVIGSRSSASAKVCRNDSISQIIRIRNKKQGLGMDIS